MGDKIAAMGKSDIGKMHNFDNIPEDTKRLAMRRTLLARKLDTGRCTSPEELAQRFNLLFEKCYEEGFIPNVEMLALASGWDRRSLWDIENGVSHKGDGMSDIIKKAKEYIGSIEASLALDGEINPTVYIFRAKNYQGLSDKQEIEVKPVIDNNIPDNVDDIINSIPELKEVENK